MMHARKPLIVTDISVSAIPKQKLELRKSNMPRSRREIQENVNTYRTGVESNLIALNSPIWDDKSDPRYISILNKYNDDTLKLMGFERELAEAKARGERGRSLEEIREEISKAQSNLYEQNLIKNNAKNIPQMIFTDKVIIFYQCNINALQKELNEAIEEGRNKIDVKSRAKIEREEKEKAQKEKMEKEKAEKEKAAKIKAEKDKIEKEKNEIKKRYEQSIRKNPNDANNYRIRGIEYYSKGYYDLAINDFTKIIDKIDPKDKEAYQQRGMAYSENKEYENAIKDFSKTLEFAPNDADTYALRGMVYAQIKNYKKAAEDFKKAIKINPKCENAYFGKGSMYASKEEYDKAIKNYKTVLRLNPKNDAVKAFLEQVQTLKRNSGYEEIKRKRNRMILCVSAPVLAFISLILIFFLGIKNEGEYTQEYAPLILSIIPFLVIFFSDSDNKVKRVIFFILNIVYFIVIFRKIGRVIDINFYLVMAVMTNLVSVVLAMIFPKDRWYYF